MSTINEGNMNNTNEFFKLEKTDGAARAGTINTAHGSIQTPVFMNVGTAAAIRGGVSSIDLRELGTQIELCNTYHLHIRPTDSQRKPPRSGDEIIRELGGLHKFMNWDKPLITDSGGFQVFSLSGLRKITEAGVKFASHVDGKRIFIGPEESIQIQYNLGADIIMAFDECVSTGGGNDKEYFRASTERTTRWLARCKTKLAELQDETYPRYLFGINQGGTYADLRKSHMEAIKELDLPGYAIGGLAVGESAEEMYEVLDTVTPEMPRDKPRYLMGVGTPLNIIEAVSRGIDMFDCVMPSRDARHGTLFTWQGKKHIGNAQYVADEGPIDETCKCPTCRNHSAAYIRHLLKANELLGARACVLHNLYFYNELTKRIRKVILNGEFNDFKESNKHLNDCV